MLNSGFKFNRVMRKLLDGCSNRANYVDDILEHTVTSEKHLNTFQMDRIRKAGLTIRLSKCLIECSSIGFTGHKSEIELCRLKEKQASWSFLEQEMS